MLPVWPFFHVWFDTTKSTPRVEIRHAFRVSATAIQLSWSPSAGATQYRIWRKASGGGYVSLGLTGASPFTDNTVTPGAAYAYRVQALDSSSRPSPLSVPDVATAMLFTDDPVIALTTLIKAAHVAELRQAVNALRATTGLSPATFVDPALAGIPVKAVHLDELRSAISAARVALGVTTPSFTDPTLSAGMFVKAIHIEELRAGAK